MAVEHRALTRWAFHELNLGHADRVLDLGCGNGAATRAAALRTIDGYVVGIDYSSLMVRAASRHASSLIEHRQGAVLRADIASLPFSPAYFDKAFAIESFYFWPDPCQSLRGIISVLAPGGQLAIAMDISKECLNQRRIRDIARRLNLVIYSGEELGSLVEQAGFANVTVRTKPEVGQGWLLASGTRPTV